MNNIPPRNMRQRERNVVMSQGHKQLSLHKAGHDPRAGALVALSHVVDGMADAQAAVDDVLAASVMVPADKRLCTELVYGTLRKWLRLEPFMRSFMKQPDKLPREMYIALLMTLYSMAFLRMPHHAAVHWTVNHVRHRFGKGLAAVANGLLRNAQRGLRAFHNDSALTAALTSGGAVAHEALAQWYGMPLWIVSLWYENYGEEVTRALLQAADSQAPTGIRIGRQHGTWAEDLAALEQVAESVGYAQHIFIDAASGQQHLETREMLDKRVRKGATVLHVAPCGIGFTGGLPYEGKQLVQQGKASRQSLAAYAALEALQAATWQGPCWDACAGRGGKTMALLEMGCHVTLVSDPSRKRLEALAGEHQRLGLPAETMPQCHYAAMQQVFAPCTEATAPASELFATVLLDVPCSGLGTLSRRPEIRLRRKPADVTSLLQTQREILDVAAQHVAAQGVIVYLTCTVNPAENQEQVSAFLQRRSDFRLEQEYQTPWESPLCEFFYGAVLRRQ